MKVQARMSLQFSDGTDNEGNPLRRQSNYDLHIAAVEADIITVGTALSSLTTSDFINLNFIETSSLL